MSDQRCTFINLFPSVIKGAEEADENLNGPSENAGGNGETLSSSTSGSETVEQEPAEVEDVTGLKRALREERSAAKEALKRANQLQKEKDDRELSEKSEVEQANTKAQKAEERVQRLTEGFRNASLNNAIRAAASNFVDPTDAVDGVDRSKLVFEQDDDDPSIVTIDMKSVESAIKALASKKPHYLKSGTNDGESTGSGFGGSQKKSETDSDAAYRLKYPSLVS